MNKDFKSEIDYIFDLWTTKPKQAKRVLREDHPHLYGKINQLSGKNLSEKAWKYIHGMKNPPRCECGNSLEFIDFARNGYRQYCGVKCMANSSKVKKQKSSTVQTRYGVSHFSKTSEYKKKFESTLRDRYGDSVSNPGQIPANRKRRARKKQETYFNKLIELVKNDSSPNFDFSEYTKVRDFHSWKCKHCKNDFESHSLDRLPKCPSCFPTGNYGGQSSIEKELLEEIRKWYSGKIVENTRDVIAPKELDLYFPKEKFAIEVNGVYWHSDIHLDKNYHRNKYALCKEMGIKLMMITDHEWHKKKQLILSMIRHRLGLGVRTTSARKCVAKQIKSSDTKPFLQDNHISGAANASYHWGLYYCNHLVAVLTLSNNRFSRDSRKLEIVRFATLGSVPGAFSKLLKAATADHEACIVCTYADLRYGDGDVYKMMGFELKSISKPGYWYYINNQMYHRLSWTKKKLVAEGNDPKLTEQQIMSDMGALRIWDCGHAYFEKEIK